MAPFRFRAAVVLDLRAREEDAAKTALAAAEAHFRAGQALLTAEEARRASAQTDLAAVERRGADLGTLLWHRNWIVRLAGSVDLLRRDLETRARQVRDAERRWHETRRKHLALERMRDRAWRRFQIDDARRDQKAMDELARIRYVMPDSQRSDT